MLQRLRNHLLSPTFASAACSYLKFRRSTAKSGVPTILMHVQSPQFASAQRLECTLSPLPVTGHGCAVWGKKAAGNYRIKNHLGWKSSPRSWSQIFDWTPPCQLDHGTKSQVQSFLEFLRSVTKEAVHISVGSAAQHQEVCVQTVKAQSYSPSPWPCGIGSPARDASWTALHGQQKEPFLPSALPMQEQPRVLLNERAPGKLIQINWTWQII